MMKPPRQRQEMPGHDLYHFLEGWESNVVTMPVCPLEKMPRRFDTSTENVAKEYEA